MTDQTPVETTHRKSARYVEAQPASGPGRPAMLAHWVIEEDGEVFTRALDVTELHQYRDDIARVLGEHRHVYDSDCGDDYGCACGWGDGGEGGIYAHQAGAVLAYLGGAR